MTTATLYRPDDGIKIYTRLGLGVYDALIVNAVARFVWSCPPKTLIDCYRIHASCNHADVGVGTGYVLDRCGLDARNTRLALFDLQPNCLEYAARRLERFTPEQYLWNAGDPLVGIAPFDSIGLGGILHCLPGDMRAKGRVFDALHAVCNDGATLFGYTLVNDAVADRLRRRLVSRFFHRLQVVNFSNDSVQALEHELARRYDHYSVAVVGCFAFFSATVRR